MKENFSQPGQPEKEPEREKEDGGLTRRAFIAGVGGMLIAGGIESKTVRHHSAEPIVNRPESERKPEAEKELKERIAEEVERAKLIIESEDDARVFRSPYLVSILYYSDAFFRELKEDDEPPDASARIVSALKLLTTPEIRKRYFAFFRKLFASTKVEGHTERVIAPFPNIHFGKGANHPDAIDLFAPEGTPVRSMTPGIVLLAESGWKKDDPLSTSTVEGGNSVIVFDPARNELYRYCHLEGVDVEAAEIISAGTEVGAVGHTGRNASRSGHGGHLHLEINHYTPATGHTTATGYKELRRELERIVAF